MECSWIIPSWYFHIKIVIIQGSIGTCVSIGLAYQPNSIFRYYLRCIFQYLIHIPESTPQILRYSSASSPNISTAIFLNSSIVLTFGLLINSEEVCPNRTGTFKRLLSTNSSNPSPMLNLLSITVPQNLYTLGPYPGYIWHLVCEPLQGMILLKVKEFNAFLFCFLKSGSRTRFTISS